MPHDAETLVVRIVEVQGKNELLQQIGIFLKFPDYYGANWDALDECLNDLDWIAESTVVLLHDEMVNLLDEDLRTYLEILSGASGHWSTAPEHSLRIIFPEDARARVCTLLS